MFQDSSPVFGSHNLRRRRGARLHCTRHQLEKEPLSSYLTAAKFFLLSTSFCFLSTVFCLFSDFTFANLGGWEKKEEERGEEEKRWKGRGEEGRRRGGGEERRV